MCDVSQPALAAAERMAEAVRSWKFDATPEAEHRMLEAVRRYEEVMSRVNC